MTRVLTLKVADTSIISKIFVVLLSMLQLMERSNSYTRRPKSQYSVNESSPNCANDIRYLDENHSAFLDTTSAAGKLTELSVSYLSFDCFASTLAEPDLTTAMRRGDYALQDYAVCNWIPHILDLRQRAGSTEILLERLSQLWKQGLSHRYSNPPDKEGAGSDPIWEESWKHLDELQEKCCNYACDDVHQSKCLFSPPQTSLRIYRLHSADSGNHIENQVHDRDSI